MTVNGFGLNNHYFNDSEKKISKALSQIAASKPQLEDGASKILYDQLISQLNGLNQGTQNLNDASGYLKVADGALSQISSSLSDVRGDLVRLNNGALNENQKNALKQGIDSKISNIQSVVTSTNYAGKNIFSSDTLSFSDGKGSIDVNVGSLNGNILDGNVEEAGAKNPYAAFESKLDSFNKQLQNSQSSVGAASQQIDSAIRSNLTESVALASSSANFETSLEESLSEFKNELVKKEAQIYFVNAHKKAVLEKAVSKLLV